MYHQILLFHAIAVFKHVVENIGNRFIDLVVLILNLISLIYFV